MEIKEKKRIAFLTFGFAFGGTEKVLSILLQELCEEYKLYLVLTSGIIEYPIPPNVEVEIINDGTEFDNSFLRFIKLPLLAWRYYRFCTKNQIDISFSFLNRPNYIACLTRVFGWKKKIFISERTSTVRQYHGKDPKSLIGRFLVKKLYPKADLIIPNSQANVIDLKNVFKVHSNYHVIYNPINLQDIFLKKEIQLPGFEDTRFTYIMLGRFVNEKDHLSLLLAFSMLPAREHCRLILIGRGSREDTIRAKISELGIGLNVTIIHFVSNPYNYLSMADCFVFSSLQEGFPNVVIEALGCSLPVISTDCKTGPRELLAPGTDYSVQLSDQMEVAEYGILVPVKKPELMAKAMERMYIDQALRESYRSKALSRARDFDTPLIIEEYRSLLNR